MHLAVSRQVYALREVLGISRGSIGATLVVRAEVRDGDYTGRGECCPTYRNGSRAGSGFVAKLLGESDVTEMVQLWRQSRYIRNATDPQTVRKEIQRRMKAGAARNAFDCALWDLEAKKKGTSVLQLLQLEDTDIFRAVTELRPVHICATVGIDTPEMIAKKAAELAKVYSILKIKLGKKVRAGEPTDAARLRAIRASVPSARLLVDTNEGWTQENLVENIRACEEVGVELIEQPVKEGHEEWLANITTHIPFCADESFHTRLDFGTIAQYYQAVNIKLDKSGGLTEALECAREAKKRGLKIMSGCMLGASLSVAPQFYLAQVADYVDADCAMLLQEDVEYGMQYIDGLLYPPQSALWG